MLIKTDSGPLGAMPKASEVTPLAVYQSRRDLLRLLAGTAAGTALTGLATPLALAQEQAVPGQNPALPAVQSSVAGAVSTEKSSAYKDATGYNNFYEFGTSKSDPERYAQALSTQPWQIEVDGLVKNPRRWALEDLLKLSPQEERIYRLRCVEGWSMVIPWIGYSLSALLRQAEPLGSAKYVEFISLADAKTMPGIASSVLDWPYVEGLRLDEAMHPLTLLAFGMYGELLPKQNGAPLRLLVPWKYGFKSAKSLVRIRLTETQPKTAWNKAAANEYGFYSNVNPDVAHPRWLQSSERRIGEDGLFSKKRKTLMFNGYQDQVAQLYAGMDLKKYF